MFYNYILKCFVLIDLKTGKLTHQDLGQMQMYVNYYTREMMNEGDNLPIGIVLCADKSESVVRYTLPEDNHQVLLPSISFTCRQRKNCARNCSGNIMCWMMLCRMKQETSEAKRK